MPAERNTGYRVARRIIARFEALGITSDNRFPIRKTMGASKQVKPNDLVFILTYNGKNLEFVEMIKNWGNLEEKPFLISITEPDNNTIQNLSDINLYIFSDSIKVNNTEISSRVSTISLMELVLYQYIEDYGGRDFNFIKR
ncbi:SIS domain-containing protein [Pediococcus pentosaceus]|nr:SIS domain-containing protein [Pediococcus pentosaceus]